MTDLDLIKFISFISLVLSKILVTDLLIPGQRSLGPAKFRNFVNSYIPSTGDTYSNTGLAKCWILAVGTVLDVRLCKFDDFPAHASKR